LKFAVICPHYGYVKRGTENMTDDINRILRLHNHKVDVFGLGEGADKVIPGLKKTEGFGKFSYNVTEKAMIGGFFRKFIGFNPNFEDIIFARNANSYLEALHKNYDLFWTNGEYWCARMVKRISKKYKKPSLVFFGGGISKMMKTEAKLLPDIFVVLTPAMRDWIQRKVPDCNVKCIPSGVRLSLFKNMQPPLFDPSKFEKPIVCSTSALIESKRVDVTIKAMAKIGKGHLFVTNGGANQKQIISLGKKLLGPRFHYLGLLSFDDLPKLYTMSNVMCMPSRNEPYGAVLFEAMACNTPVVAQRDTTREWMVGDGGVLVNKGGNVDDVADGILSAYNNIYGDRPRKQAEKFSWSKTVAGYEKAIKEVMDDY